VLVHKPICSVFPFHDSFTGHCIRLRFGSDDSGYALSVLDLEKLIHPGFSESYLWNLWKNRELWYNNDLTNINKGLSLTMLMKSTILYVPMVSTQLTTACCRGISSILCTITLSSLLISLFDEAFHQQAWRIFFTITLPSLLISFLDEQARQYKSTLSDSV